MNPKVMLGQNSDFGLFLVGPLIETVPGFKDVLIFPFTLLLSNNSNKSKQVLKILKITAFFRLLEESTRLSLSISDVVVAHFQTDLEAM